jgi:hypothetical protein
MKRNGAVEVRSRKAVRDYGVGVGPKTADTYHVKYKTGTVSKAQAKPKVKNQEPRIIPKPETEVLVLRHLADLYRGMSLIIDQQDALIEVLKGTLADLAETKDELEQERQRRNWWDKVKGLFE